jgi:nitrogen regulatory protein P-II 1
MKEIKAIIQPFMATKVIDALREIPELPGVTVSSVKGFGRGRAESAKHKVIEDSIEYAMKTKLEIVVADYLVEKVVDTIQKNAHTGNVGDGKIFIYTVNDAIRIRTGERGEKAL